MPQRERHVVLYYVTYVTPRPMMGEWDTWGDMGHMAGDAWGRMGHMGRMGDKVKDLFMYL
eukprot:SAG11_NODE_13878_length_635_cov_0.742537_2_plen_60_part_00